MVEVQGGAAGHGASGKVGARDQLAIVSFGKGRWHQHQALGLFCHGGANFKHLRGGLTALCARASGSSAAQRRRSKRACAWYRRGKMGNQDAAQQCYDRARSAVGAGDFTSMV